MKTRKLPSLPIKLYRDESGKTTTGNDIEDERLANAISWCKEQAAKCGQILFVNEHPKHGLTIHDERPECPYIEVFPGGRVVFRERR